MDYVIHTFGGQELLVHVFNGIARVFRSDSEYFTPVASFALSFGAIWAGIRAMFHGNIGIFGKQWFLPAFLAFTFLFSPKASVWIKDDVIANSPVKVDNIPFAIAFFSSISSTISYALSEIIETQLVPAKNIRTNKSGLMFGAKIVGKLREATISDPILLDNTKQFTKQCFTKPWIMGNILGLRRTAMQSSDIFAFVKKNNPNNFGIYYKDKNKVTFRTCKQAIPLIEAGLKKELQSSTLLQGLGTSLGITNKASTRIKAIGGDALDYLQRDTKTVHSWLKQAMMLNANRESIDDWRESYGHSRIYPQLINMNATRGKFQQSFGWLIAGEMAAETLPLMQTILFAIIICAIFIVFPLSMLSGGINVLTTWIKMLLWINSWPVFFSIINCLGMKVLSLKSKAMGGSVGLSILSQGAYSEMVLNSYAMVQLFASMVPIISWVLISKNGQTFANLTERLSPIAAGSALGASMVDNTLNLDNVSLGNKQIAQQNLGASLNMGSRVSDGITTTTQSLDATRINQLVSSGATKFNVLDAYTDSVNKGYQDSAMLQNSLSKRQNELTTLGTNQAYDFSSHLASGKAYAIGWSDTDQANFATAHDKIVANAKNYAKRNLKDTETSASLGLGVNGKFSLGGAVSKLIGIGLGFNVDGRTGVSARNSKALSSELTESLSEAQKESINKFHAYSKEGRFTSSNDSTQKLAQSYAKNIAEQEQVAKDLAATKSATKLWSNALNQVKSGGTNIQEDLTDSLISKVMADTGKDHQEALAQINQNPQVMSAYLQDIARERYGIKFDGIDSSNISADLALQTGAMKDSSELKSQNLEQQVNDYARDKGLDPGAIADNIEQQESMLEKKYNDAMNRANSTGSIDDGAIKAEYNKTSDFTGGRIADKIKQDASDRLSNYDYLQDLGLVGKMIKNSKKDKVD